MTATALALPDAPRLPAGALTIDELWAAAQEKARKGGRSDSTRHAYASDLKGFEAWCSARGFTPYPLDPQHAALYLTDLQAQGYEVATIARRRVSIAVGHKRRGLDHRIFSHPVVDEVWKRIRREIGVAPKYAKAALLLDDLRRVVAPLRDRLIDVRDRALLLVAFTGAFRRSEVVGFDVDDVRFVENGVELRLRRSKTDQEGEGRIVGLPYGSRIETCPVRALRAWLNAAGIAAGPLFRAVDRHGNVGAQRMSGAAVALIVKRRVVHADLDPAAFAGHSLRAGFATSAAMKGITETTIAAQTGHKSLTVLRRYIRPATIWQNNAAAALGL